MNFKNIFLSLSIALVLSAFPSPAFADDVFTGNVQVDGDLAVNGGNITTTNWMGSIFNNTGVYNIQMGNSAGFISIGNYWGSIFAQGELWVQRSLTVNGGATFSPNWTDDITVNTDSDSTLILNGLDTSAGDPLCLDASNNVVKCAESFAAASKNEDANVEETIKSQQAEIDQLKKEIEELKAAINR